MSKWGASNVRLPRERQLRLAGGRRARWSMLLASQAAGSTYRHRQQANRGEEASALILLSE
jgi:hypothetical protein